MYHYRKHKIMDYHIMKNDLNKYLEESIKFKGIIRKWYVECWIRWVYNKKIINCNVKIQNI